MIPAPQANSHLTRRGWSDASFRTLVQHASDIITVLDADGRVVYESPAILAVLGYTAEELVGADPFPLIHPDDAAAIHTLFRGVAGEQGASAVTRFASATRMAPGAGWK